MKNLLMAALLLCSTSAVAAPEVGDPAPAFNMPGSDGQVHSLEKYRGKQAVVIAFFPKAFTGG